MQTPPVVGSHHLFIYVYKKLSNYQVEGGKSPNQPYHHKINFTSSSGVG